MYNTEINYAYSNLRRKKRIAFLEADSSNAGKSVNLNFIKSPISLITMESFLSSINNIVDINFYGTKIFDIFSEFVEDNKDNENYVRKITNFINENVIPNYRNLKSLKQYLNSSEVMMENCKDILPKIETYIEYDRIIDNDYKINKRFNVDKYLSNATNESTEELVHSLCEFIDTYDIAYGAKFNLCLENIPYSFYKNNRMCDDNSVIYEGIVDYFLTKDTVLTDYDMKKMRKIIKRNQLSESINPYLMTNDYKFSNLLESVFGKNVSTIKSERELSDFIFSTMDDAKNNIEESSHIIDGILAIPLVLETSKSFIESQLTNYMSIGENEEIKTKIQSSLDEQYHSSEGFDKLHILNLETKDNTEESYRSIMESNELENDDIKNLLKQFKAEQKKDASVFKRVMNKIYAKEPSEIIDNIPHIFGLVRSVFIFAPIGIPVVGPVLSLLVACVDKLINIHIDLKQTDKLLKFLKKERDKVENSMSDLEGDKLNKAKEYKKSLDSCIEKTENYKNTFGDAVDYDSDDDFDLDFDLESCINSNGSSVSIIHEFISQDQYTDDMFHTLSIYEESLGYIMEKNDIMNKISRNMDSISESIGYIAKLAVNCPINIDYDSFCEMVKDYHFDPLDVNSMSIDYKLENAKEEKIELGTTRNVIVEAYCTEALETIINEGFKLSNVKLLWKGLKEKIKDLSVKEKSICQSLDAYASTFLNSLEKAIRSDRREAIIKGSIIPSFSRCIKLAIGFTAISVVNPVVGLITALGYFGTSKALNRREKQLIYDEIETELKVVEKELQMAENDGDMQRYRFLLNYQKKLVREKQRIKYNLRVSGRSIPSAVVNNNDD